MKSAAVNAYIEIVQNIFNDFTESQRYDSQIISFETKYRNTDQYSCDSGNRTGDNHRCDQTQRAVWNDRLQTDGRYDAAEGAHAHKPGMSETQFPQNTHRKVQRDRHDDIYADRYHLTSEGTGDHSLRHHKLKNDVCDDHHSIGNKIASRGF